MPRTRRRPPPRRRIREAPPLRGDRPGWHNDTSIAANKAVPLSPSRPFPPLLTPNAPREKLEGWLSWADPNGRFIDWEDPDVSEEELWQAVKTLAADVQALGEWSLGYNDDLNAFAAVRYPSARRGRMFMLVMNGEQGDDPEPGEAVYLALLELDEDAGEWVELHAADFRSPAEATYAVETDPKWGIA